MFVETLALKRDGLRGKKLAKSMAAKFPSYSADELRTFAEHVPSPELRARHRGEHLLLLGLLAVGSVAAAASVFDLHSRGDRSIQGLGMAGLVLLCRAIPIIMVARYRRDGALFVYLALPGMLRQIAAMDFVNIAFGVALTIVATLWVSRLFPKLTWRGQLR